MGTVHTSEIPNDMSFLGLDVGETLGLIPDSDAAIQLLVLAIP